MRAYAELRQVGEMIVTWLIINDALAVLVRAVGE